MYICNAKSLNFMTHFFGKIRQTTSQLTKRDIFTKLVQNANYCTICLKVLVIWFNANVNSDI